MDCPKCGYSLTAFEKDCPRCRRIAAEEFAKSPAAVWPPAIGPQAVAAPLPAPIFSPAPILLEEDNSSGEERGGPPEIESLHWNWGAFFCGWLWCFFHRTLGIGLLVIAAGIFLAAFTLFILPSGYALPSELMAVVLFGLCCYLGMHGHQFAWERRRFPGGVSQYLAVQRAWAVGGAAAFGVSALFCVTLGLFFLAAFRAYEARRQAPPPAAVSQPISSGPPPVILRRPEPAPGGQPTAIPMGGQGFHQPGDYQRHFNPNSRSDFEPNHLPSGYSPMPQPNPSAPDTTPIPPAPSNPGPAAPPSGLSPGGSSTPNAAPPTGQTPPPYSAPAQTPPAAPPNTSAAP